MREVKMFIYNEYFDNSNKKTFQIFTTYTATNYTSQMLRQKLKYEAIKFLYISVKPFCLQKKDESKWDCFPFPSQI